MPTADPSARPETAPSGGGCTVRRAGEYSLLRLAEQHAAGFEGYAAPVRMDASGLADRVRSEHIDLWSSFALRGVDDAEDALDRVLVLVARRGNASRVASMGVPTHARRMGWGRLALALAVEEARGRGDSLQLEVLTENHGAVDLYRSAGFEVARTLVGFEGTLAPHVARDNLADARPIALAEAAARVAAYSPGLPWQLEAATLHGLGGHWRAWTNGPSVAVATVREDTLVLQSVLTDPEHRRVGHARALLDAVARAEGVQKVRVISIVPEGLADAFFLACGLELAPLRQYEMVLTG